MARNKFDIDESMDSPFNFNHLFKTGKYLKKHLKEMIIAFLIGVAGMVLALLVPQFIKYAVDNLMVPGSDKYFELIIIGVIVTVLLAASIALFRYRELAMNRMGNEIIHDIRRDLFVHLQKLSFQYYDSRPNGKILVRVINYVNNVSEVLSNGILNLILEIINLIFMLIFMLITSWELTLLALAGIPIIITVILIFKPIQRKGWQSHSNKQSNMTAYLSESLDGIKITQAFTREEENAAIYDKLNEMTRDKWVEVQSATAAVWVSVDMVNRVTGTLIYVGGALWFAPAVSFGTILAMAGYASRFWQPILNLSNLYNSFITAVAYLERIFETMNEPVSVDDKENAYDLPAITGEVKFDNVTFAYEKQINILENVNFTVSPGQNIALVGPTGAGKTTVVNLISRFYDLSGGAVLIDGHNIADVTLQSLRSQMGIMMQDSFIFSGTILDNIRYGKLDATFEDVVAAAKTVYAHDYIMGQEKGYDTEIGERGGGLSAGEKQLISFARTLISDPKILILDEATSSIDIKTEKLLQKGLQELLKGRTSFIVAHRLSTIQHCDKIMYISEKGIAESGTHQELLKLKGKYYDLYSAQKPVTVEV